VSGGGGDDDDDDDGRRQREINSVAAARTAKMGNDTHLSSKEDGIIRPAKRQRPLPSRDPSPSPSKDEAGNHSDSCSDDKLINTLAESDKEDRMRRPAKRKRPSSSYHDPTQSKRRHLRQRSTRPMQTTLEVPLPS
jgi:hypothetical protein